VRRKFLCCSAGCSAASRSNADCCGLLPFLTAKLVKKSGDCEHVCECLRAARVGKERETLGDGTIHASQTLGAKG